MGNSYGERKSQMQQLVAVNTVVMLLFTCFHAPLYSFRQSLEGKTPDREIEGFWEGTLIIDNSQLIQVLTRSKGDSRIYCRKLEILHKGTYAIDAVTEAGVTIRVQISQMQAVYEGTLDKGRSKISGHWIEGGRRLPLSFERLEEAPAQQRLQMPVDLEVSTAPTRVKADHAWHLVYELHATNFGNRELTLTRVEVLGQDRSRILASYEGTDLSARLFRPGIETAEPQRIGGGLRVLVFVWVTVSKLSEVPGILHHRLVFRPTDAPYRANETAVGGP